MSEEGVPSPPSSLPEIFGIASLDVEMDTQGLQAVERDFGVGIAKKRLLTTKGVSLKELYEIAKA